MMRASDLNHCKKRFQPLDQRRRVTSLQDLVALLITIGSLAIGFFGFSGGNTISINPDSRPAIAMTFSQPERGNQSDRESYVFR